MLDSYSMNELGIRQTVDIDIYRRKFVLILMMLMSIALVEELSMRYAIMAFLPLSLKLGKKESLNLILCN